MNTTTHTSRNSPLVTTALLTLLGATVAAPTASHGAVALQTVTGNIALYQQTYGDVGFGVPTSRGVDGNTGNWTHARRDGGANDSSIPYPGEVTNSPYPYWQVDLAASSSVDSISIYNRNNQADRLEGSTMSLFDSGGSLIGGSTISITGVTDPVSALTFDNGGLGWSGVASIRIDGTGAVGSDLYKYFQIAEFEANGTGKVPLNWALGATVDLFDDTGTPFATWGGSPASNIVDGDRSSFSHPGNPTPHPDFYYEVDLGQEIWVDHVDLFGRSSSTARLEDYEVQFLDASLTQTHLYTHGDQTTDTGTNIDVIGTVGGNGALTQFVRIINANDTDYGPQVTELEVFGIPAGAFINVGPTACIPSTALSTDKESNFRLGGGADDFATVTDPGGLSVVAGSNPKHIINIELLAPIAIGTYPLIDYEGSIGGLGFTDLELAPLGGRYVASLVDNTVNTTVDLVVTAVPGDVLWKATVDGAWDVEATANWELLPGGTPTTFFTGDPVFFDDTAASGTVTLSGSIMPSVIEINNSSLAYSFSGDPISGNASVDKQGTGTVTFGSPNDYTGTTVIGAGTVRLTGTGSLGSGPVTIDGTLVYEHASPIMTELTNVLDGSGTLEKSGTANLLLSQDNSSFTGNIDHQAGIIQSGTANCLGDATGTTTVASGATLDINGFGFGDEPISIIGTGVGGLGAIINEGPQQFSAIDALTLAGDATIGGTNRWDIRGAGSTLVGNFALTKIGPNVISCVSSTVTIGDLEVTDGSFSIEGGTVVDDTHSGMITVSSGHLNFGNWGTPVSCTKPIVLNGGTMGVDHSGSGGAKVDSPISLMAASNEITTASGISLLLDGIISGSGSLQKTGDGTLDILLAPTYTGDTEVDAGTLVLNESGLDDDFGVSIGASATLELKFAGSDTVDTLVIGGIGRAAGIWGAAGSGAPNTDPHFDGTGTLNVLTSSETNYGTWTLGFAGLTNIDPTVDFELDGLDTGIEYVVGGDPTLNDAASVAPTFDNTTDPDDFLYTYRRTDLANTDPNATIIVQYGSDLTGWTTASHDPGGTGITISVQDVSSEDYDLVTVAIPRSLVPGGKLFVRLSVDIAMP